VKEFQASRGLRGLEISDGPSDNFGSPVALLRAEFYTPRKSSNTGVVALENEMKVRAEWLGGTARAILAIAVLILSVAGAASLAHAQSGAALMNQVNAALRTNARLNGARAYTAAEGVVVLYGVVFDDNDRMLAVQTAGAVPGVSSVVDNLRTKTGKWFQEEERIVLQLQMNGFNDVQVKVVGPYVYLSGQVTGQAAKQRAASVVNSVAPNLQINNMIWAQPGSMF
jgi:osmotically-inducible protein OsmY